MSPFMNKVARLARSPQGRELTGRAMTMARDPRTRQRIVEARSRLASRGRAR